MAFAIFLDPLFDAFLASTAIAAFSAYESYLNSTKQVSISQQALISQQQFNQFNEAFLTFSALISIFSLIMNLMSSL